MKLFSLFSFALLSVSAVLSIPINFSDGVFRYWLSDDNMKATITGVVNEKRTSFSVNPYVVYNGKRYYVNQIGTAAFSHSDARTIVVNEKDAYTNDRFIESINISPSAFYNAKNLRSLQLDTDKVTADAGAFDGLNTYINFSGKGVPNLVNDYAKKLLNQWNLPIGKDYTNATPYDFNKDLFNLAVKVKENFGVNDKVAYKDNVAVVLALKSGSTNGIARAFRILARNMGYQYNDVHVGGDNGYYSWNYVYTRFNTKTNKKWYNVDIINTSFSKNSSYRTIYKTSDEQSKVIESKYSSGTKYPDPRNWIIYINEYNYSGETYATENFYSWLVRNRAGVQA
ncbi:hypothetical protein BCR36DRAFT_588167 [Piromyces finnis]|uniref:Transglutaminase-like domain-containing protein n=1 Tax=Piromyces finnis TaxID=1754191 RepID=A0A1Y1UR20_9FUNG|nr:hypothetical protein BCR36DRAFT_588167 [Piromyces finnis]|eukprot:ORX40402.1 hypothetical protein BCR36DRAFT_588167 [Piromyces finnis]